LRRYRENLGYTLSDAARVLECHASKVSRIETGERGIRAKELRELLAEYGIGGDQLDMLTLLSDPRGAFGWHREYDDILHGAWKDYLLLETAATRVWSYEAQRVPALLQTPGYARALADADPSLEDAVARDRAVDAVMARQHAILGEHHPAVHLVISQAALHQQVGSTAVMDEQLRRLAQAAADSDTVTVQVLPFEAGAHAATAEGALGILQLPGGPRRPRRLRDRIRPPSLYCLRARAVRASSAPPRRSLVAWPVPPKTAVEPATAPKIRRISHCDIPR
jgi:transcriptional regulator with XRE-family HTH domain